MHLSISEAEYIDPLAAKRPVILIDHAYSRRSNGHFSPTMPQNGLYLIDIIKRLGLKQEGVMGFSGGGCTPQMATLDNPTLVRRLIFAVITPSIGRVFK